MKNIIIGTLSTILLILIMLFIFTVYGRNVREQEINDGLNNAMKIAVEGLMEDREYLPESNEEFISDFTQAFIMHVNSASTITIEILDVDYKSGLLSVRVTSEYKHLTGAPGKVSLEKTIILEQYTNENAIMTYTVSYFVEGIPYKQYDLDEGTKHVVPANPTGSGTFKGWKVLEGSRAGTTYTVANLANLTVTENVTYIAVFQ